MINLEEKIIILGALFHDIGKFEQRCTNRRIPHTELGYSLFNEFKEEITKILDNDSEAFKNSSKLISNHHFQNSKDELVNLIREADHLSASERVGFDKEDDYKDKWSHKYLTSLFSKIYLNDSNLSSRQNKYYNQKLLNKNNYKIIIPQYETEKDIKDSNIGYPLDTFNDFKDELRTVLSFYESADDFNTLVSLILILFEKYMWCIPDFKGSTHTDISLFNHLKDVAGISQAIYKSKGKKLNLIIGDIPGIQKYIFNVTNVKPAKILRGRSIYVQILTRQFASIILNKLGLTEASLIMLAGGKFYIISQDSEEFENSFNEAKDDIEHILIKNFNYQLSFSSVSHLFDYEELKNKEITFGDIIDEASYKLLLKRNQQFENILFENNDFDQNDFVLSENYIEPQVEGNTNSIKCAVTDLPIKDDRLEIIKEGSNEPIRVDKQVFYEHTIGKEIPKNNVVIELDKNFEDVIQIKRISKYKIEKKNSNRILINPVLDDLLKDKNLYKDILRNALFIEVANYTSKAKENEKIVMDFNEMEKDNNGAEIMTLLKGDVDNLGLIMSSGLIGNKDDIEDSEEIKDLTGISRTTTLSNHLKYFFSFSLNGFLDDWEQGKILTNEEKKRFPENVRIEGQETEDFKKYISDRKVYTVFAGGDDIMLICPQSSSLKLLSAFNETFNKFICYNPEVHISYSLTNFKHNTPIRIVADMAEDNQSKVKSIFKTKDLITRIDTEDNVFHAKKDKAGTLIFDTIIKNYGHRKLQNEKEKLIKWVLDNSTPVTMGTIRNLFQISEIIKEYEEKNDSSKLIWHPMLTYYLNRNIRGKKGTTQEIEYFFKNVLSIYKDEGAKKLQEILYPVLCETIYKLRK